MKIIKTASGKKTIKMSKSEWTSMGKTAGWMRTAGFYAAKYVKSDDLEVMEYIERRYMSIDNGHAFGQKTATALMELLKSKGIPNDAIYAEIESLKYAWDERKAEAEFENKQLAGGWSAMTGDDI